MAATRTAEVLSQSHVFERAGAATAEAVADEAEETDVENGGLKPPCTGRPGATGSVEGCEPDGAAAAWSEPDAAAGDKPESEAISTEPELRAESSSRLRRFKSLRRSAA